MASKKIIVVFGATGAQGGGLARAILNDPNSEFSVRAVTRDVNSDKAKALASLGAELVAADIDDATAARCSATYHHRSSDSATRPHATGAECDYGGRLCG